jgi:hypothetical protein
VGVLCAAAAKIMYSPFGFGGGENRCGCLSKWVATDARAHRTLSGVGELLLLESLTYDIEN